MSTTAVEYSVERAKSAKINWGTPHNTCRLLAVRLRVKADFRLMTTSASSSSPSVAEVYLFSLVKSRDGRNYSAEDVAEAILAHRRPSALR